MKKKIGSFRTFLSSWLIGLSIVAAAAFKLFHTTPMIMVVCTAISIIAVLLVFKDFNNGQRVIFRKVVISIIGLWLWCVVIANFQGAVKPLRLEVLERLIYTLLLAFLFCNFKPSLLPLKVALYLVIAFFYFQYFILGIESYGVGDLDSGAVNTVVLLTISITIQILDYRDNQRIALLPALLIVPISIMSWNRSGFIVSLVYLLAVSFVGTSLSRKRKRRVLLYVVLSIGLVYLVNRYSEWFVGTGLYSKFERNALDNSARASIWESYFYSFDLPTFFFGRAIDENHPLIAGFLNPHNSFIMLHSLTGIYALFIIVLTCMRLWQYFRYNRFLLLLFSVLIVRSLTDMVFFFQPFDYVFYIFIFDYKNLLLKRDNVSMRIV